MKGADAIGLAVVATTFDHRRGVHAGLLHARHRRPVLQRVRPDRLGGGAVLAAGGAAADAADGRLFPEAAPRSPRRARRCRRYYQRLLDWALDHQWLSAAVGGRDLLRLDVPGAASCRPGFQPAGDPGYVYLSVQGPPGATRADMERAVGRDHAACCGERPTIERRLRQIGSAAATASRRQRRGDLRNGTITVILKADRKLDHRGVQVRGAAAAAARSPTCAIIDRRPAASAAPTCEIVLASQNAPALERGAARPAAPDADPGPGLADPRPSPPPPGPELVDPAQARGGRAPGRRRPDASPRSRASPPSATSTPTSPSSPKASAASRSGSACPQSARADLDAHRASCRCPTAGRQDDHRWPAWPTSPSRPARRGSIRYDRERQRLGPGRRCNGVDARRGARRRSTNLPIMKNLPAGRARRPAGRRTRP